MNTSQLCKGYRTDRAFLTSGIGRRPSDWLVSLLWLVGWFGLVGLVMLVWLVGWFCLIGLVGLVWLDWFGWLVLFVLVAWFGLFG